jgi:hypothetical protein
MPSDWPYGDIKYGSPGESESDDGGATFQSWAHYTAIQPVTEMGGRAHPALGGGAVLGYHVGCIEDYYVSASSGRWFSLFTPSDNQNGSDLTNNVFHASERRLLGGFHVTNGDEAPDLVTMHNTIFACDGKGRWLAGQAPPGFVFNDDGGANWTDESADAADTGADDVLIFPSAAAAVDDALYIGAAAEFEGFWMDVTTALTLGSGGTTIVTKLEYYNGSAWVNVTLDNNGLGADQDTPYFFSGTAGAFSSAQQMRVAWTRATNLSDWTAVSVNSQSAFWVRIRISSGASGSGYSAPLARSIFLIEDNAQKTPLLPASYEVGEDPGTTAPSIKAWGLHRLDVNGTEQVSATTGTGESLGGGAVNVWYAWWDSAREIGTDPVSLGNYTIAASGKITLTIGSHPDPNIDKLRVFFQGTGGAMAAEATHEGDISRIGIGLLRLVGEFTLATAGGTGAIFDLVGGGTNNDRTTAWETIDRRFYGDGPYLASTIPNGVDLQPDVAAKNGYYKTCCAHKGRIYCAGTDVAGYQHRVVWSIANNPYCFPKDNFVDVPMADGERIVAIRAAGSVAVVLGSRSVWALNGDPESSAVSVSKIADVGCLAKRAAITVGQRCFFLGAAGIYGVGSAGAVELITPGLTRLFRDIWETTSVVAAGSTLYQHVAHVACAGYDPSREFVLFAIPGLLQQFSGAGATNQDFPDACLQIDLVTGRSTVLVFDLPVTCMASIPMGNNGMEIWHGTPLGRLRRLDTSVLDANTTAAISGTAAGTHSSTTLQDTGLSLTASTADSSFVGQMLYKTSSTGANPEGRMITSNDTDTFTVNDAFTNTPVDGDLYYIGTYWMSVETGDITHDDPGAQHRLTSARLHLEAGMNSSNALNVLSTDESRVETTTWTTGGALTASTKVEQLSLGGDQGFTQRMRVLVRMGAARFRLFAMAVKRTLGGRPRG